MYPPYYNPYMMAGMHMMNPYLGMYNPMMMNPMFHPMMGMGMMGAYPHFGMFPGMMGMMYPHAGFMSPYMHSVH